MPRYYLGVDWADRVHQLYGGDENGIKVMEMKVQENPEGLAELGRWLNRSRAEDVELWAGIEKPHGRIVDFLLDHGVVVYPINPKVLDRARDRFRMSQSKSDSFDAWVLSEFLRTDHGHLRPLRPNSEQAAAYAGSAKNGASQNAFAQSAQVHSQGVLSSARRGFWGSGVACSSRFSQAVFDANGALEA